ncbi:MAG: TonB-dependent receptor [Bacteroidetes bacterium]|nr:TonB-dependent receptor [Bacteroidota bacterium]
MKKNSLSKRIPTFFCLMLLFCMRLIAQTNTVTGVVKDDKGQPIAGVTVKVAKKTTTTDADGRFVIEAAPGARLTLSHVGFTTKEIAVNNERSLEIGLEPQRNDLGEVVVIGYGSQRRREVTGAVSTVDVTKMKDVPVANVTRFLTGQAPGVTVKQTSGTPGQEAEVTIRGLGSLGAGSEPLYVIDGFPVGTSIGQNINPNDIASMTVLKDAVSTAIYGARGSNGVILITTKNAKSGEMNLSVAANYGIQNIPDSRRYKMLDGPGFAQFKKDIFMDKIRYFENREPNINEVPLDYRFPEQTKRSTNWFNEILHNNAPFQNYNVTLSNGNTPIHSLLSLGYVDQEGALINTRYKLYSIRANIGGQVNKYLGIGFNVNGSYSDQNQSNNTLGRDGLVGSSLLMDPRDPVYNPDGSYDSYIGGHDGSFGWANPVQVLKETNARTTNTNIITNGFFELSFLRNFKFKSVYNAGFYMLSSKQYIPSTIAGTNAPPPLDASEEDNASNRINLSTDQLLTYSRKLGGHSFEIMGGFTAQKETLKSLKGTGSKYPDDLVPYLNAAVIKSSSSGEEGWSTEAFFGRLNYNYKDRYLFSGTFRREGSSRFGINNKWGNFPALSAGWRISDEAFMAGVSWINDLKVRGSWGITGNNNIGNYASLSFLSPSNYILGNNFASGQVVSAFANTQLGWERSSQTDIGMDLAAFNNKFTFTAEYYNRITSDMLLSIQLPAISGFTSSLGNVGKVRNRGIELAAGYRTKIDAVGVWGNFNISFNRNKVLAIRGVNDEIWNGAFYDSYNVSKVGRPIGMIYGYKVLGIFRNQQEIDKSPTQDGAIPGVYKYADADSNGTISYDTKDMVEIGNPWPKGTWALSLGADYKKFDLTVLVTGAYGYDLMAQLQKSTMNMDGVFNVLTASKDRFRSEQNPGNGVYATTNTWKWERESNSRYIYNASHVWLKNVSLGYTFSKVPLFRLSNMRLFVSADNLILFTNYPGNNPEANNKGGTSPGFDDVAYPVSRTFSAGLRLSL